MKTKDWIPLLPLDIIRLIRRYLSPKDLHKCFSISKSWYKTFVLSILKLTLNAPLDQSVNFNFSRFSNLQALEITARSVKPAEFDSFLHVNLRTLDINWRRGYSIDKLVFLSTLENLHLHIQHQFNKITELQTTLEQMNLKTLGIHVHNSTKEQIANGA
jgi:hypothetical protein